MDFVNKQHVTRFEVGEQPCEVARFFQHGAGRQFEVCPDFIGDNVREGGFAQAGWPVQQYVVERVASFFGSLNKDLEVVHDLALAAELFEEFGAKCLFNEFFLVGGWFVCE